MTEDGITNSIDVSLSNPREIVKDKKAWCAAVREAAKSRTRLSDRTIELSSLSPPARDEGMGLNVSTL